MADMYEDMQELKTVNQEREALGLEPLRYIEDARVWKQEQKAKPTEEKPTETPAETTPTETTPKEEAADHASFPTAPTAKVAEKAADVQMVGKVVMDEAEAQALRTERGRASKLSIQMQALEQKLAEAEQRATEAERKAQLAASKGAGSWLKGMLTPEQLEAVDANMLDGIARGVESYVQQALTGVEAKTATELAATKQQFDELRQREQQRAEQSRQAAVADMWQNRVSKVISPSEYGKLGPSNPKWVEWCGKTFAGRTYGELYTEAVNSADADAVVDLLQKAMRFAGIEAKPKGTQPPLKPTESSAVVRTETPAEEVFYEGDYRKMIDDFSRGEVPTGMSAKEFRSYLDRAKKARDDGRMKLGFKPRQ